jgi:hypothetical protein
MITEVALGVVLGVLILLYWREFLALGLFATIGAAVIAILAIGVFWLASNEQALQKVLTLLILAAAFLIGLLIAVLIAKRSVLTVEEIGVLLSIAVILVPTTSFFIWFITKWATEAGEPGLFLYLLPLVGLWYWLWLKLTRLRRSRNEKVKSSKS